MKVLSRNLILAALAVVPFAGAGCSEKSTSSSKILVTDVEHSAVKRQSIGNCWLYAEASWIESMHLKATGEEVNLSESYWTWWHFYDQIVNSRSGKFETGGQHYTAARIIERHGLVMEGDFIPDESNAEMSNAQSRAESLLKAELQSGGRLGTYQLRNPRNVRRVLDEAFGSNMAAAERIAIKPSEFVTGKNVDGSEVSLAESYNQWTSATFPIVFGQNAVPDAWQIEERREVLTRVLKALNDHQPVMMTVMIDFNALDTADATFKKSTLDAAGHPGRQGGHMVVLEDYVVKNAPGFGYLGEGEMSEDKKIAALSGELVLLKAKNSWGTNRSDRGLTDGYTRFDVEYLTGQLPWKFNENSGADDVNYYTTLSDFLLPPGY